jgi:hypothetical protein
MKSISHSDIHACKSQLNLLSRRNSDSQPDQQHCWTSENRQKVALITPTGWSADFAGTFAQ